MGHRNVAYSTKYSQAVANVSFLCQDSIHSSSSGTKKQRGGKRKHPPPTADSPTKMKRLRLILGKETMSTVNYS